MKKVVALLSLVFVSTLSFSQTVEDYVQLIKSDLNTEKRAIFIENMQFNEEESKMFWPIYDEYRLERDKMGSRKMTMYQDYMDNYENLNTEKGDELMEEYFSLQNSILDLEKKYFKKIKESLSTQRAVQFFQIEHRINMLIQLEVMSALPISEPTE